MDNKVIKQSAGAELRNIANDAVHFRDLLFALNTFARETAKNGAAQAPYIQEIDQYNWVVGGGNNGDSLGWTMEEAAKLFVQRCIEYGAQYGNYNAVKGNTDDNA